MKNQDHIVPFITVILMFWMFIIYDETTVPNTGELKSTFLLVVLFILSAIIILYRSGIIKKPFKRAMKFPKIINRKR